MMKCFINGLDRLDLMHLLALRKLKYCCKSNNCSNMTMFHALQCYKLSREYLTYLLSTVVDQVTLCLILILMLLVTLGDS